MAGPGRGLPRRYDGWERAPEKCVGATRVLGLGDRATSGCPDEAGDEFEPHRREKHGGCSARGEMFGRVKNPASQGVVQPFRLDLLGGPAALVEYGRARQVTRPPAGMIGAHGEI